VQDLLVGSSAVHSNGTVVMSGCLGDLVRGVEKFEVHTEDPG